ncbi:MAG: ATP-binding protein [Ktedonobacteraceae bacterium]
MEQAQHSPVRQTKKGEQWKRYLIDAVLAIMVVVPLTLIIFALQLHPGISTTLLVYLFIVLWLVYQRGFWIAVLAALTACVAIDFFLIRPLFSFAIAHTEDELDLFVFLLLAIMLGYMYSKLQARKHQEHAESILYQERLRKQTEEVTRHDYEADIFYNVVQVTRDKNDLKYQLGFITRTIEEAFSFCGLRSCVIFVPDLDGKLSLQRLLEQENTVTALTSDEMRSVTWVMEKGVSVTLPNIPLIARAKGSYLRRVVVRSTLNEQIEHGYSYIVPLLSGQKVLGVLRLLVEDNAHPRLLTIKSGLEIECPATDMQPELFTKLKDYAVSLIKQALIERALMQEECMRQELSRRTEELQAAIISSVSHDLRTPLVAIRAAASNLLDEEMLRNDNAEHRLAIETIIDEADWLGRILVRMIDLSRIEQGALKLDKDLYPIETVILTMLESRHMHSLLQGRTIETSVPEDLPPVEVDPVLIGQVLANLVENAIRYTPAEAPVEINVQTNRGQMLISVADRGPGIPPAETERIFEKFYRVRRKVDESEKGKEGEGEVPKTQGTGLGLAVCQGFVAAHGGRIWVQNRAGGGAEFSFTLPLKQAEARDYQFTGARRRHEKNTRS